MLRGRNFLPRELELTMMVVQSETGCHAYAPETWSVEGLLTVDFLIGDDPERLCDRQVFDIVDAAARDSY